MDSETTVMELLGELQIQLAKALDSLGGRGSQGLGENFVFYSSSYINRAVEGFIYLRKGGRIDSAKLMIRPAIETMFRLQAVQYEPELLYRIAYSEILEDRKWYRPAAERQGKHYDYDAEARQWRLFELMYAEQFPTHKVIKKRLPLIEAAKTAGSGTYYDTHYRMYCKYSHAALAALGGYLDELADPEDSRTMVLCAFCAVQALSTIGAVFADLDSLQQRIISLTKQPPAALIREKIVNE
jgi:hypothetical protein